MMDDISSTTAAQGAQISGHAEERWAERTAAEEPLSAAWEQSVPIQAPDADADECRLYAPYDALLVSRRGVLRTVLHNDGRVQTATLGCCSSCDNLLDPLADETCRWCGAETETHGHGQVTITRGELQ